MSQEVYVKEKIKADFLLCSDPDLSAVFCNLLFSGRAGKGNRQNG